MPCIHTCGDGNDDDKHQPKLKWIRVKTGRIRRQIMKKSDFLAAIERKKERLVASSELVN